MKITRRLFLVVPLVLFNSAVVSFAQSPNAQPADPAANTAKAAVADPHASPTPTPTPSPRFGFVRNLARDQKAIGLSPFRLKKKDLEWFAPLAATATVLVFTDPKTSSWVSRNGSLPKISHDVSLAGSTYAEVGFLGGFYLMGRATGNRHAQETAELAAEALIDTSIVTEVLKYTAGRLRPNDGTGQGAFFKHGSSFPSGHSSSIWSIATVVAYEYKDRPLIRYAAIATAVAVSLSRYSGRNHFLSDILIGSSIGLGTGRLVYMSRH